MANAPEDIAAIDRRMSHSRGVAQLHYERLAGRRLKEKVVRLNWNHFTGQTVKNKSLRELHVAEQLYRVL
jgi:hypothetical protein